MNDKTRFEIARRVGICATLATLMSIGVFALVASLMWQAIDHRRTTAAVAVDQIPVLEVTVIKGKRQPVPVANVDTGARKSPRLELI